MATLHLLAGGEPEEIPCTVISAEPEEDRWDRTRQLRQVAKARHTAWLACPCDLHRVAYGAALFEYALYVDDRQAKEHAEKLMEGR